MEPQTSVTAQQGEETGLDYRYLLLVHIMCADERLHIRETAALNELADCVGINPATRQAMAAVLHSDDYISIEETIAKVPPEQQLETLQQVVAIAYADGFFCSQERQYFAQIVQQWHIDSAAAQEILMAVQRLNKTPSAFAANASPHANKESMAARILKGATSLLSQELVEHLTTVAPEAIARRIDAIHREILLAGPGYEEAIQHCTTIAHEDFKYAQRSLSWSHTALDGLANHLKQSLADMTESHGQEPSAQEVKALLQDTWQSLGDRILTGMETVQEELKAKERSLNHFSIAFMGKTKAGKSTLHAVMTKQGWDGIGTGKQRTTRYNRVYEWKHIRIIDTPGIGAPGGKTDEEIASGVVAESDVICYVVTDDSIQESEFQFLQALKERTKPLIVLLNIKQNLRDRRRLQYFLKNPGKAFALDGRNGIGGHIERIKRYARQHYPNAFLEVIPVMLLAAQMAQEPAHQEQANKLFKASRIQQFLDAIRISLIDHGPIRRSQTLLGSTVSAIERPRQWIHQQAMEYQTLSERLDAKQHALNTRLQQAQEDAQNQLNNDIKETFELLRQKVPGFANKYWEADSGHLNYKWKKLLGKCEFKDRIDHAIEKATNDFQAHIRDGLDEITTELELIEHLQTHHKSTVDFNTQNQNWPDQDMVRIGSMVLTVLGAVSVFIPPLAAAGWIIGGIGAVVGMIANIFKSKEQRKSEAVGRISHSLYCQLEIQEKNIIEQTHNTLGQYCHGVSERLDTLFTALSQELSTLANHFRTTDKQLKSSEVSLNQAYAKRIIDWAMGESEPLNDMTIRNAYILLIESLDEQFILSRVVLLTQGKT